MNIGLPASMGRDLFARVGSAEDLHSCQSGGYGVEDVAYVIDGRLAAGVGELGRSVGSRLDR